MMLYHSVSVMDYICHVGMSECSDATTVLVRVCSCRVLDVCVYLMH